MVLEEVLRERPRRLRGHERLRGLVRETKLGPDQLVQPLFIEEGLVGRRAIPSMPGLDRVGVDAAVEEAGRLADLGLGGVLLFGIPAAKDALGTGAHRRASFLARAMRGMKEAMPGFLVMGDVCLCEYTDHGHCGVLRDGAVSNDETLVVLAQAAVMQADAGADVVAPSAMMDGQVAAIRLALDAAGHAHTPILSYAAKYASAFYGPFREAAASAPRFGDRRSYQLDPANRREGLREIALDLRQGADFVLIKPGLPSLDLIHAARQRFDIPLGAYQVSGEYAMLELAAREGWLDRDQAVLETLSCLRRAGADFVISYHAAHAASVLRGPA